MASGIKDKVAIVGMGCSKFGERWDCGPEELILEAFDEAIKDAPVERNQIEMAWLGLFSKNRAQEIRVTVKYLVASSKYPSHKSREYVCYRY